MGYSKLYYIITFPPQLWFWTFVEGPKCRNQLYWKGDDIRNVQTQTVSDTC